MTESNIWGRLRPLLLDADRNMHAFRHEDRTAGVPDCSFCLGGVSVWLELKSRHTLPRNPAEPVGFPNLKKEQRNWIFARGKSGAQVFLLTVIRGSYYLFGWWTVRQLGKLNLDELKRRAVIRGDRLTPAFVTAMLTAVRPSESLSEASGHSRLPDPPRRRLSSPQERSVRVRGLPGRRG